MIKFATSFARSGFGLGVAIGLMVTIHLHALVQAKPMMAADTSCNTTLSVPPEVQAWIDLQCQVNEAIFSDGLEPSSSFAMDTSVTQPGTYTGTTYDGRSISLDVVFVVEADLANEAPQLVEDGVTAYLVIATMTGDSGDVQIAGVVMKTGLLTLDNQHLLLVSSILSDEDYAAFANATRIAGGVRVLNVSTFSSQPLSSVTYAELMWATEEDPASLYMDNPGGNGAVVEISCTQAAYKTYQIAVDAARAIAAVCIVAVVALFAICMGACGLTAIFGPVSFALIAICAAVCLAEIIIGLAACTAIAAIDMKAAMDKLVLDLLVCGVSIV